MDVYEFIKEIRRRGIYTVKRSMVVEGIYIYVNDGVVYKIVLHCDPAMLKKAHKLGMNGEYVIHNFDNEKIKLKLEDKFANGRNIIMYDTRKNIADCYQGEDSEEKQKERLKRKRVHVVNNK